MTPPGAGGANTPPADNFLRKLFCALTAVLAASLPAAPAQERGASQDCSSLLYGNAPLIIAHRGASGYLPEHTLEAYRLAIELGADYIETDLVSTRDGVLIARHEPNLLRTTDVANHPEFAGRRRVMNVDGVQENGFFAGDFTLAEIKTLRVSQVFPERSHAFDGRFQIATLAEILQLIRHENERTGRRIGFYVETKHAAWHRALGLPLEDLLLAALKQAGYDHATAPVFVESFEPSSLQYMHARSALPMIQLIDGSGLDADGRPMLHPPTDRPYDFVLAGDSRTYADMLTPRGLREVARYAAGIGVWKSWLLPARCPPDAGGGCEESQRSLLEPTRIVADAHAAGLLVHPFTFRSEPQRLARDYQGDPLREYRAFYALGVDGVITDFPDAAMLARRLCVLQGH